jgi:hypothetical protein
MLAVALEFGSNCTLATRILARPLLDKIKGALERSNSTPLFAKHNKSNDTLCQVLNGKLFTMGAISNEPHLFSDAFACFPSKTAF